MARLDQIYIPAELCRNIRVDDYTILGDNALSDHLPIRRWVVLEDEGGGLENRPM
jgi:hypothetical protein